MRHDFEDQIQVRYRHSDGQDYDTWVRGSEAEHRLQAEVREQQLKAGMGSFTAQQLEQLPAEGKKRLRDRLQQGLADGLESFIGGNVIGDTLSGRVRGPEQPAPPTPEPQWQSRLQTEPFRAKILELAWIQLRGSFPDEDQGNELTDWV